MSDADLDTCTAHLIFLTAPLTKMSSEQIARGSNPRSVWCLGFGQKSANVTIFAPDPFLSIGDDEEILFTWNSPFCPIYDG